MSHILGEHRSFSTRVMIQRSYSLRPRHSIPYTVYVMRHDLWPKNGILYEFKIVYSSPQESHTFSQNRILYCNRIFSVIVYFTVQSIILYDSYITMGHIPLARYDHMQVKPVGKESITII